MAKDTLELFSFKLDESTVSNERVNYLYLPKPWRDFIRKDREGYQLKIKPKNLGKKLQAVFSKIFHVSWRNDEPWLLADEKVDPQIIKLICLNWFATEEKCSVSELPAEVQNASLVWEIALMGDLYRKYKKDAWRYDWIPGLMARKFSNMPHFISIKNGLNRKLKFHHVYFNNKHECMSEPIKGNEKDGYFSYVIRFSLKTRGGLPEPSILNVSFGIRRFLQKGISISSIIHPKRKGSILFSLKNPFIQDNPSFGSYAQLKFRRTFNGHITWAEGVDKLFADLLQVPFQPYEILKDPNSIINHQEMSVLVVYSDLVFQSKLNMSKVLSGIGLPEKSRLYDYFREKFPELQPLDLSFNISRRIDSMGKDAMPLQHSISGKRKINLEFWGEKELFTKMINTYLEENILSRKTDNIYSLNAEPAIDVEFTFKNSSKLAEALNAKEGNKAYERRVKWIKKFVTHKERNADPVMTLVEIDDKDNYEEGTDPKSANRIGLALANRISQFIYPLDSDEKESATKSRILNSLYDLLSDYGFLPASAKKLNQDRIFLGLGLIKGKKQGERNGEVCLPVVTKLFQNEVRVRLFGNSEWLPPNEALISASKIMTFLKKPSKNEEEAKRYKSFFKRALEDCLNSSNSNIVVFVDARLRNEKWYELTNPSLEHNQLPMALEHPEAAARVRAIRVNTTDDVPQYRINPKGEVRENRNQGLFKDSQSGIYYSVGARPDSMQKRLDLQKYNSPRTQIHQQRLVEFIPLETNIEEERDQLAKMAHNLRRLNIAYSFHTVLPYPLHIIKSIKKYVMADEFFDYDTDTFEEWEYEGEDEQLAFKFEEIEVEHV